MLRPTLLVFACTLAACDPTAQPAPERHKAAAKSPAEAKSPQVAAPKTPLAALKPWEGGLPPHLLHEPTSNRGLAELAVDSRLQDDGKLVLDVTTVTTFNDAGDPLTRRVETPRREVTSSWVFTYEGPHLPAKVVFESKGKTTTRKVRHEFDDKGQLLRTVVEVDSGKTLIETFSRKPDGTYTATRESVDAGQTHRIGHDLFDSQGHRLRKCIEGKACTSYRYDTHGNLLGEHSDQEDSEPIDYEVTVDAKGRESSRNEPGKKNLVRTTEYNAQGRILKQERRRTQAEGDDILYEQLAYRYTLRGEAAKAPAAKAPAPADN